MALPAIDNVSLWLYARQLARTALQHSLYSCQPIESYKQNVYIYREMTHFPSLQPVMRAKHYILKLCKSILIYGYIFYMNFLKNYYILIFNNIYIYI